MKSATRPFFALGHAAFVAAAFACHAVAYANPSGGVVVSGSASIVPSGNVLQVTHTPNSIINWQNFSIGSGEITRFTQQSAASAVLNRVTTQNPSAILGALESNGRVFLVNPNGILFGTGSRVDVAGLVASTLNITNADFLAGRLRFEGGNGLIVQAGTITTPSGGQVHLVGGHVLNAGQITAPNGEVVLAAGQTVELVDPATPNLRVEITATDQRVVNLGQIAAQAGRIGIFAGLIDQAGTLNANTAVATDNGRIVLRATGDIHLLPGSTTSATGPGTGIIQVQSLTGGVETTGAGVIAEPPTGSVSVVGAAGQPAVAPITPAALAAPAELTQEVLPPSTPNAAPFDTGAATSLSGATAGTASPAFQQSILTPTPTVNSTSPTLSSVPTLMTGVPTLMTGVPTLTTSTPTLTTGVPTVTTGAPTSGLSPLNTGTSFFTLGPTRSLTATPTVTTVPFSTIGSAVGR